MVSSSYSNSNNMLIYSNLAYLFPLSVLLYKIVYKKHFPKFVGFELAMLYCAVMYFSMTYHMCRSDIANEVGDDVQYESDLPDTQKKQMCPIGEGMYLDKATLLDHIFAFYALATTILYLIPMKSSARHFIMTAMLLYIIVLRSYNTIKYANIIIAFPTFIAASYFVYYIIHNHNKRRNFYFVLGGGVVSLVAIILFMVFPEPYWLNHSLWHILGAIAGGLLLFPKY
jgi:hypothetical protein